MLVFNSSFRYLSAFIALALFVILSPASINAQENDGAIIDQVIAIVGGEYILLSDLEEQYALMASQNQGEMPENSRGILLNQLMTGKLLYHQSKLDSVEVAPEEVEQQLEARIDRILAYMNYDEQQFEDYYGQTVVQTKEQFRADLQEQIATERMQGQIIRSVRVTPSEVRDFFAQIPADSLPYFNAEVEVGEIVKLVRPNDESKTKARERLEALGEQIKNGEITFADAARANSMDGTRQAGGDLGWARRGKYVPEFEAAAYNLEPGEMSDVVETEFGYHILLLQERRGSNIHVSHILIRPSVTDEDIQNTITELSDVRELITTDSINFSRAVKRYGYDKVQSYTNDGRMVNPQTGAPFFETGDLDYEVYFAIDTLEVGDVTAPMQYRGPGNDPYVRIVQLQARTPPHRATLSKDYSKIQEATRQSKQNEYLKDWIDETMEKTYIWIDERYHGFDILDPWLEQSGKLTVGPDIRP
ncbi:MAG: peptidylprolyl isomerase [Bacteroidota bacterium]